MRCRHSLLLIMLLAGIFTACVCLADAWPGKKIIATGWDQADTARLRQNLAQMEQTPFNGVVVTAVGVNDEGKTVGINGAFNAAPWKQEWFQKPLEDLQAVKSAQLTDNFLALGANPGNVDWFDDEGWKNLVEHWRIAAWLAKAGGLKGIRFDPEPYTQGFAQFSYAMQAGREQHTFAEYAQKARERGREVMRAVAKEFPDCVLFTYFMNSANATAAGHPNPTALLTGSHYGLYAPFIDGWLDEILPQMILVDGCENAYLYNSPMQYLLSSVLIKGDLQSLVSPENRAKYRAQVQVSFGIYLDAYSNPATSQWYIQGGDTPRVELLRRNVSDALRAADEYVWVYGEKFRWWPTPNGSVGGPWEEALPGISDALRFAAAPADYGRRKVAELAQAGQLQNLLVNADFGSDKAPGAVSGMADWQTGAAPAGWSTWQETRSKGTFSWDREVGRDGKGSARASAVGGGCFIQTVTPVAPGELYAVQGWYKLQGQGTAWIRVRWQTPEGKWHADQLDRLIYSSGQGDGWRELFDVAQVPEGAGKMVILLGMAGQQAEQDVVWFDDIRAVRLK